MRVRDPPIQRRDLARLQHLPGPGQVDRYVIWAERAGDHLARDGRRIAGIGLQANAQRLPGVKGGGLGQRVAVGRIVGRLEGRRRRRQGPARSAVAQRQAARAARAVANYVFERERAARLDALLGLEALDGAGQLEVEARAAFAASGAALPAPGRYSRH